MRRYLWTKKLLKCFNGDQQPHPGDLHTLRRNAQKRHNVWMRQLQIEGLLTAAAWRIQMQQSEFGTVAIHTSHKYLSSSRVPRTRMLLTRSGVGRSVGGEVVVSDTYWVSSLSVKWSQWVWVPRAVCACPWLLLCQVRMSGMDLVYEVE